MSISPKLCDDKVNTLFLKLSTDLKFLLDNTNETPEVFYAKVSESCKDVLKCVSNLLFKCQSLLNEHTPNALYDNLDELNTSCYNALHEYKIKQIELKNTNFYSDKFSECINLLQSCYDFADIFNKKNIYLKDNGAIYSNDKKEITGDKKYMTLCDYVTDYAQLNHLTDDNYKYLFDTSVKDSLHSRRWLEISVDLMQKEYREKQKQQEHKKIECNNDKTETAGGEKYMTLLEYVTDYSEHNDLTDDYRRYLFDSVNGYHWPHVKSWCEQEVNYMQKIYQTKLVIDNLSVKVESPEVQKVLPVSDELSVSDELPELVPEWPIMPVSVELPVTVASQESVSELPVTVASQESVSELPMTVASQESVSELPVTVAPQESVSELPMTVALPVSELPESVPPTSELIVSESGSDEQNYESAKHSIESDYVETEDESFIAKLTDMHKNLTAMIDVYSGVYVKTLEIYHDLKENKLKQILITKLEEVKKINVDEQNKHRNVVMLCKVNYILDNPLDSTYTEDIRNLIKL